MIIMKIHSGLGNQMFQYACGKALAHMHSTALALDRGYFEAEPIRPYELDNAFGIDLRIAPKTLRTLLTASARSGKGYTIFREEKTAAPDFSILSLGSNLYLEGYFQNEQFFLPAADQIRNDFTFGATHSRNASRQIEQILATPQAVAAHIRRGDYLLPGVRAVLHLCDADYYREAVSIIKKNMPRPTFFVFSRQDMEWGRRLFETLDVPFSMIGEEDASAPAYEDMRMMSLCKHNIIANSSFSWWGAWLNGNPEKMVIAPQHWFTDANGGEARHPAPAGWIRI